VKPEAAFVVSECENGRPGGQQGTKVLGRMASYRLYRLDGVRMVSSGEWIEADDDHAAIEAAKEKFDGERCEVWQGRRLVARLDEVGSDRAAGAAT
jgi:hypothetical protein